ncbi:MAG: lipopolysaccharide kinase InaA family protein, partial [Candidatus Binatia bacterium]
MRPGAECTFYREGDWSFLVHPEIWSQGLWNDVIKHLDGQAPSHHPQTKRLHYPAGEGGREFYLKIYHRPVPLGTIKDLFRSSKAFLALRQARAMLLDGFHTPFTVAAGEKRTFRFIRQAFLLTLGLQGTSLPLFLKENFSPPLDAWALKKKRGYLKQLALEIRRLHQSGFVHGDLVPHNI